MVKANRNYEIYIIVDGNFDDPTIEGISAKYENFMKKNGAEILNIDKIGRRRLAYPIKKKVNGYYTCFEILAPTDVVGKLEKNFRIDENILRHLAIQLSPADLKEKQDYLKKKALILAKLEAERVTEENNAAASKAEAADAAVKAEQ
ncbi:MAG: 30S ribosomal protein S6 [Ignavibacteria bacterium]|nr:30S ribosomal protein S6 [Ignavibacteria bacterium]